METLSKEETAEEMILAVMELEGMQGGVLEEVRELDSLVVGACSGFLGVSMGRYIQEGDNS